MGQRKSWHEEEQCLPRSPPKIEVIETSMGYKSRAEDTGDEVGAACVVEEPDDKY